MLQRYSVCGSLSNMIVGDLYHSTLECMNNLCFLCINTVLS